MVGKTSIGSLEMSMSASLRNCSCIVGSFFMMPS
jgi:hypothetical protein